MADLEIDVTVEEYRYTMTEHGAVTVYRNGEHWPGRAAQGDGMLMTFAARIQELERQAEDVGEYFRELDLRD